MDKIEAGADLVRTITHGVKALGVYLLKIFKDS